jgi:Zn-dependent protease
MGTCDMEDVYFYAAFIPIVAYSIILHEIAHAVAALWAGDDTAKLMNRITLNPIPHIDLFGTIILPGILIILNTGVVFGWAKPVPVNPYRFRRPVRDDIIVSLAGVAVNLILAYIFILLLHLTQSGYMNQNLFLGAAALNIVLAIFNLIPIPPLDGSHVFKYLLPKEVRPKYEMLGFYGMFLIFIFLAVGGHLLGTVVMGAIRVLLFLGGHGW